MLHVAQRLMLAEIRTEGGLSGTDFSDEAANLRALHGVYINAATAIWQYCKTGCPFVPLTAGGVKNLPDTWKKYVTRPSKGSFYDTSG